MQNDLSLLVKDIPQNDLEVFRKGIKETVSVKECINKIMIDYSWIDVIDETIPYLDRIINNPRRFIVQEEDVIPIEKTKRVSEESVKHLAVHTNLIQDVDEDGMVKPAKLLNIFREETIDLYENRFIYTLIKMVNTFLRNELTYKEESINNKEEKKVTYEANTIFNNRDINITMNLSSNKINESELNEEEINARNEKINNINDIIEGFMGSKFMKTMANATPVRSPIRRTNLILKEQNFKKALQLWEYLERYQVDNPVKEIHKENDLTNKKFIRDFDMTFFLNYGILNESISRSGEIKLPETANLEESVYEYALKFDVNEEKFKNDLISKIKKASNYKKEQKNKALNIYNNFINVHNARIKKAISLLK